ncbi:MAG: M23 family metallopeptidase [Chitinophagaceae bacterium]|nr:M23 family metallopeptidase [Chitinophagaceae bacterium]
MTFDRIMFFLKGTMLACIVPFAIAAQPRFVSPIAGVYGTDYKLVNYVDWAVDTFIKDHYCSSKTYDGHQGTDFVIRNFKAMDAGVDVLAADKGKVIFVQDGLYDREKTSVVSKLLGNYIGITHDGKLQTYYGHLRTGSVLVKVGDTVAAGQKIAQVGSSGNSSDPHLHFELWYDSTYYIDPFSGPCGNATTYWLAQPAFDTSFGIWTSGMCNYVCTLDTLKEEPNRRDTFYATDPAITYWNLQYGLRKNDSVRIDWYHPSGSLWLSYGLRMQRDQWYYYFWSYISTPPSTAEGKWTIKYYRNNILAATQPFYYYQKPNTITDKTLNGSKDWQILYQENSIKIVGILPKDVLRVYTAQGQLVATHIAQGPALILDKNELAKGMYIITKTEASSQKWNSKQLVIW